MSVMWRRLSRRNVEERLGILYVRMAEDAWLGSGYGHGHAEVNQC